MALVALAGCAVAMLHGAGIPLVSSAAEVQPSQAAAAAGRET
jgi:hypothetical protein